MRLEDLDPKERRLILLIRLAGNVVAESERQRRLKIASDILSVALNDDDETEEARENAARILENLDSAI